MARTAEAYLAETNMLDFKLICDMGVTSEDVEALRALPEVREVSPSYSVYVKASVSEETVVVAIHSFPKDEDSGLSLPVLEEGRMPTLASECLVDAATPIPIGSIVTVSEDNRERSLGLLGQKSFVVVGRAYSPSYISTDRGNTNVGSGRVGYFLFVPEAAFESEYYTELNLSLNDTLSTTAFSKEYDDTISALSGYLEDFTSERGTIRYEQIWNEASAAIAEGESDYEENKTKADYDLAVALQEISSGRMSLEDGEAAYSRYSRQLAEAQTALETGEAQLASAGQTLDDLREQVAANSAQLDAARGELDAMKGDLALLTAQLAVTTDPVAAAEIQTQIDTLTSAIAFTEQEIRSGESTLAGAQVSLDQADSDYRVNSDRIGTSRLKVEADSASVVRMRGELDYRIAELSLGQKSYDEKSDEARKALNEARKELDDSKSELDKLEIPVWYVQSRQDLPGYAGFVSDINRIGALADVLPLLLFLIAALVSLTTMTRLVEEHRTQIGTLKALGYHRRSISAIYQWYAWTISLLGGLVGVAVGLFFVPEAIWQIYGILYHMGDFELAIVVVPCAIGVLASAFAVSVATFFASRAALRSSASELMRPQPPRMGRRVLLEHIRPIWSARPLGYKLTFRNLFRYKARFFMTIVGVAGCTALLLTGFGIRDSADSMVGLQYGEVAHYQATLVLKEGSDSHEDTVLNKTIADYETAYAQMAAMDVSAGERTNKGIITYLFVPENPEELEGLISFRDRISHEPLEFPAQPGAAPSALITERLAKVLDVSAGDTIKIGRPRGQVADVRVAGVVENYVYNYIYLSPSSYEILFREAPVYSSLVLRTDATGGAFDALMTEVATDDNVATILPVSQLRTIMDQVIASMTAVVWLLIAAASLLALIVLYSLSSINITERARELATLKVLGFLRREVSSYISRETTMLTLLGLILGLIGGIFLHQFVMASIEVNEIMFARTILPQSFLFAALITLVCSAAVAFIMRFRIKRIEPVSTLKSNE
jgi:putative ABC transport system permease protein